MDAAQTIRDCIANVNALRLLRQGDPVLGQAIREVKSLQARRFQGTYADLLASPAYGRAARFFLQELYSDQDYTERDAQFGRIAGALQRLFPRPVVETAVALGVLHSETESLDQSMGQAWQHPPAGLSEAARYAQAWRTVGQRQARQRQLTQVLAMGHDLARLTRTPGLRMALRMMRGPAQAAGMSALQNFLEAGFDTFGQLSRQRGAVEQFLTTIEQREAALMTLLFDGDSVACETQLLRTLGQAR